MGLDHNFAKLGKNICSNYWDWLELLTLNCKKGDMQLLAILKTTICMVPAPSISWQ